MSAILGLDVSVATAALRTEAGVWDRQSDALQALTGRVDGLRMTGLESGLFIVMLDAYTRVVDVVTGRCGEGAQRTTEIATTLRQVADVYDEEEQRNLHRFSGLY